MNQNTRKNLCGFWFTYHFQYRQWDRKISDEELVPILRELKAEGISDGLILVHIDTRDLNNNTLFIKIKSKTLITCFVCNLSEYRGKNPHDHYILSNQVLRKSH